MIAENRISRRFFFFSSSWSAVSAMVGSVSVGVGADLTSGSAGGSLVGAVGSFLVSVGA